MMNNLFFNFFDPSSSILSLSWMSVSFPITILISMKYKLKMKWTKLIYMFTSFISKEMTTLMGNTKKMGNMVLIKMIFSTLIFMNSLALLPFIFTPTAHIAISFSTAISMWLSIIIFGLVNNTKNVVTHMVPVGTPNMLMNFMVLIELISNLIRPITLSVRLSANMVAGHLLMSLLSNFCLLMIKTFSMSSPILFLLTLLEMAVAMIQAYVFVTLITLYHNEVL